MAFRCRPDSSAWTRSKLTSSCCGQVSNSTRWETFSTRAAGRHGKDLLRLGRPEAAVALVRIEFCVARIVGQQIDEAFAVRRKDLQGQLNRVSSVTASAESRYRLGLLIRDRLVVAAATDHHASLLELEQRARPIELRSQEAATGKPRSSVRHSHLVKNSLTSCCASPLCAFQPSRTRRRSSVGLTGSSARSSWPKSRCTCSRIRASGESFRAWTACRIWALVGQHQGAV